MSNIRNIGDATGRWLAEAGVESVEELERVGVVEAYRRVKSLYPSKVSLNLLWALQGAVMDLHWADVPDEVKMQLQYRLDHP